MTVAPSPGGSPHHRQSTSPEDGYALTPKSRDIRLISLSSGPIRAKRVAEESHKRIIHKRKGRVVSVLREQFKLTSPDPFSTTFNINPSCSTDKLGTVQLRSSLTHHLIRLALPLLATVNCTWNNVDTALDDLRRYGSPDDGQYLEAIVSCAATLGALSSNHSAVVGPAVFDHPRPPPIARLPAFPRRDLQTSLGRRRQAACAALADRAVAQTAALGLIGHDTERARTLATLLRVTVGIVAPGHPFLQEVNGRIHSVLMTGGPRAGRTLYADRTIGADLVLALATAQAPVLGSTALSELGWTDFDDPSELLHLCRIENYSQKDWYETHQQYRTLALGTLRKVIQLQQEPKLLAPSLLHSTFTTLGRLVTGVRSMMHAVHALKLPQPTSAKELGMLHLPLVLEGALLRQARRHARTRSAPLFEAQQRRFLRFLSDIIHRASRDMDKPNTLHLGGAMLELLEVEPGWMGLIFEGVRQFEAGEGPLMGAGVVREDLFNLEKVLAIGSTLFASLGNRHDELLNGLAALDAGKEVKTEANGSRASPESGSDSGSGPSSVESEAASAGEGGREELASAMVQEALSELYGNVGSVPSGVWAC